MMEGGIIDTAVMAQAKSLGLKQVQTPARRHDWSE